MNNNSNLCFHCQDDLVEGSVFTAEITGATQQFCCPACVAVAECIQADGLGKYYEFRDVAATRPNYAVSNFEHYDLPEIQQTFVVDTEDDSQARLLLQGIHCSACTWLIEQKLKRLQGLLSVRVNLQQQQALIHWDSSVLALSVIMQAISELGYEPQPWSESSRAQLAQEERKSLQRRMGVAGLLMMQVGMLSIGLYAGEFQGMGDLMQLLLRTASGVFATIIVLYSAQPFFKGAWRGLKQLHPGMDLPVVIAVLAAYLASIRALITQNGDTYFDTVCMFVFFLLLSRFLEARARSENSQYSSDLIPRTATKFSGPSLSAIQEVHLAQIASTHIQIGDVLLVRDGELLPVDGIIIDGESSLDESVFTGEPLPVHKAVGAEVLAGSINVEQALLIQATEISSQARLQKIESLLAQAQSDKPVITQLADRLSSAFVSVVIVIAVIAAWWWSAQSPEQALLVALAVLVVSCPCALSLATPTAMTVASNGLRRAGILSVSSQLLETLPKVDHAIFDKTGTLTKGIFTIEEMRCDEALDADQLKCVAASLEAYSSHPIATAFRHDHLLPCQDVTVVVGRGVQGSINGEQFRLGSAAFCSEQLGGQIIAPNTGQWLALCSERTLLAWFRLQDTLRDDALITIQGLQKRGIDIELLSGDASSAVRDLAEKLNISLYASGLCAEQKLNRLQELQSQGKTVMAVGDGVNDVPLLAAADISVAVSNASDMAKTQADVVLASSVLLKLPKAIKYSELSNNVIRQNIVWALLYNGLAVPLAAVGLVPPWLAAIGMSLSSIIVVANAQRLRAIGRQVLSISQVAPERS